MAAAPEVPDDLTDDLADDAPDPGHDGAGVPDAATDGLAVPRDPEARHGEGVDAALVLGGGGVFFVAWQVAYLNALVERGVPLHGVDRIVGTSAGALVAAVLGAGKIGRFRTEVGLLARVPRLLQALAPSSDLRPSQERARDVFLAAEDAEPSTVRAIGHAALSAHTPGPNAMARNVALVLASRRWPSPSVQITCVDAYSGERCVVTEDAGVPIARAVAASSAVPGLFPPQPVLDRRCIDGGVSGTGTHLDLVAGARRVLVVTLTDGEGAEQGAMTVSPTGFRDELAALEASGAEVVVRMPETMDLATLMDPREVPRAVVMGERQAAADAERLRALLA
jgi:NTE family protein